MSLYAALAVLSAAVVGYEVLLIRLYALVQWQHFGYMIISIALLGFGVSGTFLTLARRWLGSRYLISFTVNAVLFGVSSLVSFAVVQRLPFNPLEIIWDPLQLLYLAPIYLLITIPFFCGANCIGLAFVCFGDRIGRIYRANLLGSGAGALGIIPVLYIFSPADSLLVIMGFGFFAAAIACLARTERSWRGAAVLLTVAAVIVPLIIPKSWTVLQISQYKGLATALKFKGAEQLDEVYSPLGLITTVRNLEIPFHYAPGLSLNSPAGPPAQLGIFFDGDSMTAMTAFNGRRETLAYLDFMTAALPYHLLKNASVVVLGAGGGTYVLQALYHNASRIDAVELNPQVVQLVKGTYGEFTGGIYSLPEVHLHVREARGFVAGSDRKWDLIQVPLLDSFAAATAGIHGLSENYVYTVDAFRNYFRHLRPGGILAISRWLKLPPRDSLKLFATALMALEQEDVTEPRRNLVMIRSWNTVTLLIRNRPFTLTDIADIRSFAESRSFDLAYFPGIIRKEANRFNVLDAPYFFEGATELAGQNQGKFLARYKFNITPASDDRPYFFDFFKWRSLAELLKIRTLGGASLLELGYLILIATLIQAAVLSVILILLPLMFKKHIATPADDKWRIMTYFSCLGLGFMFIEIAFIQRFIVFLSHPLFAVAVVLSAFLVFAGIGSGFAPLFERSRRRVWWRLSPIRIAVLFVAGISLLYILVLPPLFQLFFPLPQTAKVVISIALIAPLGFFMGLPFPLGLSEVSARLPELVPWAWGVNGCASVIGVILTSILAVHFGFTVVVALAAALYIFGAAVFHHSDGVRAAGRILT